MATYLDLSGLQTYHNKMKTYIGTLHEAMETEIAAKQNKLTAGNGISIDSTTNVISFNGDTTIFIFAETLPDVSTAELNKIYVVPSEKTTTGNLYTEYFVKVDGETRTWEKVGEFKEYIDLSDYYKKAEAESMVDTKLANYAKSADVYTKTAADARFVNVDTYITTTQIDNIFA